MFSTEDYGQGSPKNPCKRADNTRGKSRLNNRAFELEEGKIKRVGEKTRVGKREKEVGVREREGGNKRIEREKEGEE